VFVGDVGDAADVQQLGARGDHREPLTSSRVSAPAWRVTSCSSPPLRRRSSRRRVGRKRSGATPHVPAEAGSNSRSAAGR
jgi:hypothetical protein